MSKSLDAGVFILNDGRMVHATIVVHPNKLQALIERAMSNATRASSSWSDGAIEVYAEPVEATSVVKPELREAVEGWKRGELDDEQAAEKIEQALGPELEAAAAEGRPAPVEGKVYGRKVRKARKQ